MKSIKVNRFISQITRNNWTQTTCSTNPNKNNISSWNEIENGNNRECVKDSITWPKSRKQNKATILGLQKLVQQNNGCHTKLKTYEWTKIFKKLTRLTMARRSWHGTGTNMCLGSKMFNMFCLKTVMNIKISIQVLIQTQSSKLLIIHTEKFLSSN